MYLTGLQAAAVEKSLGKIDYNPYAHYIHIGKPGDKIFDVVESTKITPDIYQNKSRAHVGTYSSGLTRNRLGGKI